MNTFCLFFIPIVFASTFTENSLEVLTDGDNATNIIDDRYMRLIDMTNDFYLSVSLISPHIPILSPDDLMEISQWMHANLDPKIYDDYNLTISSLTEEISRTRIIDWRVLSMISSHLSIIPLMENPESVFHLSHQLGLVWRRIATNKPLPYTVFAVSIFSTGLVSLMPKLLTDFTIALVRCIDGQLVPEEQLDQLIAIGQSTTRILGNDLMSEKEIRKVFKTELIRELDIESVSLMGRWDSRSDASIEYVFNTVFGRIESMKERLDQVENLLQVLWRMDKFFEDMFATIPQPILGGSGRLTLRSPVFLKGILQDLNRHQLGQYISIASDVIFDDEGSSLSTFLGFNAALELGIVRRSEDMNLIFNHVIRKPTDQIQQFDRLLRVKWLNTPKSTWAWDAVGTLLNVSILKRIAPSEVSADLIELTNDLLRAMNEGKRDKADITSKLIIPCKKAIKRLVDDLKSF